MGQNQDIGKSQAIYLPFYLHQRGSEDHSKYIVESLGFSHILKNKTK